MKQEDIMKLEAAIAADYSNIAGMVVRKDGETVYERYFGGCTAETRLNVFSVTKSIISILLGIALDRGCLGSIDQQVLEFFPEYTPKRGEKTIQRITIRDMLTMTAPYKYRSTPYTKYFTSPDWVRFSLDLLGGKGPVGEFRYAPLIGPDILTGILTRVTGQSVLDFAKERLFAPLGIPVEQSITFLSREELMAFYKSTDLRVWAADPAGVNAGGWGLTLSPMDLAKLGQLYLDGGISDAIPLEKSILDGNRKNIVVMTKEVGFVRKPASASQLGLIKLRYLKYPKVYELMADRHIRYNESLDYIERQEKCGQAFVIRPHKKSDVGRIEKDKDKLIALYEEGYREAEACYEDLLAYLEK